MNHKVLSKAAALLTMTIWGLAFMFSKIAFRYATPYVLLAYRFTVAFLVLELIRRMGHIRFQMKGKPVGMLLLLGLIEPVLYFFCENNGILYSSASFSGVMIALIPIATLAGAALFLRERATLRQILFSVLSVAGVVIMSVSPGGESLATLPGVLFMTGAVAAATAFILISRGVADVFTPFERTWFMFAEGCICYVVLALLLNLRHPALLAEPIYHPGFLGAIAFLGILSSVVAFFCQNYYVTYLTIPEAAVFSNLATVVSILSGILLLHEPFTARTIPCTIMIIAGVIGVQLGNGKNAQ